jgi:S1-C subfamily serine protease
MIVAFGGARITGVNGLVRMLDAGRIGRSITVTALRGSAARESTIVPADHAARKPRRSAGHPVAAAGVLAATG